jgi:small-conductance mechanosensitive channel
MASASARMAQADALSEGWVAASGIALGFYCAYQAPRTPGFIVLALLILTTAFAGLVYAGHWGERRALDTTIQFLGRFALYLCCGVVVFFVLAWLFGPIVTGVGYPMGF